MTVYVFVYFLCVYMCVDVQLCTITGVSALAHVCMCLCVHACSGARYAQTKGLGSDNLESGTLREQSFQNLCHLGAKPLASYCAKARDLASSHSKICAIS